MPTTQADLIDRDLLTRRRLELAMTQRDLGKAIGLSATAIGRLEHDPNAANDFPLSTLRRLADALALHPPDLLRAPEDTEPRPVSDSARVGRLLAETTTLTPIGTLVEVLTWSLARVRAALDDLAAHAPAVGMRLHRAVNGVKLVPGPDAAPDDLKAILRKHQARAGLRLGEARVLYRVMTGNLDVGKLGNSERVALGRLSNAGLVEVDGATAQLTADAAFSLSLGAP